MSARFGPGGNCEAFYAAGNKSTAQVFEWLHTHGLQLYEYQGGRGVKCSAQTASAIAQQARQYGIALSVHAPYYISIASEDAQKRGNSVDYVLQSLTFAQSIGAAVIVCHAGGLGKQTRRQAMELSRQTLFAAACAAHEQGLAHIKIGIETMGKENQSGTLDEVLTLCKTDPIFAPVVDFGHLYARSLGKDMRTHDDYLRVFEQIEAQLGADALSRLHCHFSKIEYTQKGEKKHLKFSDFGFGPCYEIFIEAVIKAGISPDVICETAGTMTADAKAMDDLYNKLKGKST
jgi:deoxyribonuclease-4